MRDAMIIMAIMVVDALLFYDYETNSRSKLARLATLFVIAMSILSVIVVLER